MSQIKKRNEGGRYREGDRRVGAMKGIQYTFIQYFFLQRFLVENIEVKKQERERENNLERTDTGGTKHAYNHPGLRRRNTRPKKEVEQGNEKR